MDFGLDAFVDKDPQPEDYEFIMFAFWERGHSLTEFESVPIPYILSMLKVLKYYDDKSKEKQPRPE